MLDFGCRIRDADAIFRIERKDDQKIAQNSKLFYRKYFEFATNHSGSVRGTLWRIVSKYILFFCAWFSHFTVGTCRTRRITLRVPRKITTDHDMRPIRLNIASSCFHLAIAALTSLSTMPGFFLSISVCFCCSNFTLHNARVLPLYFCLFLLL